MVTKIFISLIIVSFYSTTRFALASNVSSSDHTITKREVLQIGLGDGGIIIGGSPAPDYSPPNIPCPPPPPPPCPPPPPKLRTPTPSPKPPTPRRPTPSPKPRMPSRIEIAREVIQEFKNRITIDPMHIKDSWNGRNACDYKGFKCAFLHQHGEPGLYAAFFNGFRFDGPHLGIDRFIERLPDISIFHANSNNFKGNVPVLSNLPKLFELDLSNNKYVGGFPTNLLTGNQLSFLDIRFNNLIGWVPPQLFKMDLIALFINNNCFDPQELPSNLGSTPAAYLTLASNRFFGSIPPSIGQSAKTILQLFLFNNTLTGCLPYEIGLLNKAQVFDASQNQLTGPIPHSFACLAKMEYLVLDHNQFYGQVPEMVCKLPLVNLSLSYNFFTQVGPECMKLVRNKVLDVRMNCILGLPDQKSGEECQMFFNKPKFCPDSNMNYIPCKGTAKYLDSLDGEKKSKPVAALTYDGFTPKPQGHG